MSTYRRLFILLGLVLTLAVPGVDCVLAQTYNADDNTILKQIIIFGRHSIRSATSDNATLDQMATTPYPAFSVQPGYLTPRGREAAALLGAYFRQYLLQEGLLTGNNEKDAAHSYFRSNSIERSYETAAAFQGSLIPNSTQAVHSFPPGQVDPVFDPTKAGVAKIDTDRAVKEAQALFNGSDALKSAYSAEFSLIRNVLFDNSDPPLGKIDPTAPPIPLTATTETSVGTFIDVGGLQETNAAADPFIMQYADNFDFPDKVAWGRLTLDQISQQTRITNLIFEIEVRSPYLGRVQSSNAASHILRTMEQAVTGAQVPGAFCSPKRSRTVVVISSDGYVAGVAGLLKLHWQLPGYQPDFCAPGGALVFELRQKKVSKQYVVRVYYTAQSLDQLRQLAALTPANPPETIQLLIPGGGSSSKSSSNLDVDFDTFHRLLTDAIGIQYVENPSQEVRPGVLTLQ
ncbi:MAG: histidine-type phosphatase [Syntrophobacter sp.]